MATGSCPAVTRSSSTRSGGPRSDRSPTSRVPSARARRGDPCPRPRSHRTRRDTAPSRPPHGRLPGRREHGRRDRVGPLLPPAIPTDGDQHHPAASCLGRRPRPLGTRGSVQAPRPLVGVGRRHPGQAGGRAGCLQRLAGRGLRDSSMERARSRRAPGAGSSSASSPPSHYPVRGSPSASTSMATAGPNRPSQEGVFREPTSRVVALLAASLSVALAGSLLATSARPGHRPSCPRSTAVSATTNWSRAWAMTCPTPARRHRRRWTRCR